MDEDNTDDRKREFDDIDEPNPQEEIKLDEEMPEDNEPPFSAPSDIQDRIDRTQQETDTNIDPHEWYDEGIEEAAKVDPPESVNTEGYDPFIPGTEADGIQERDKEEDQNNNYL